MAKHAHFEELSALALLRELNSAQLRELDEHIAECEVCRQANIDYSHFFQHVVPTATKSEEEYIASRKDDVRAAVMRSVSVIDQERERRPIPTAADGVPLSSFTAFLSSRRNTFAIWGGLSVASLIAVAFWAGAHLYSNPQSRQEEKASSPFVGSPITAPLTTPAKIGVAYPPTNTSKKESPTALDVELQRNAELTKKLSVTDDKLMAALKAQSALRIEVDQQAQAFAKTVADLDAKTTELAKERSADSSNFAKIAALELQIQDLNTKVNLQAASLERERDLLSHGREIRDIIGARSLHIIDVYDTSSEGTTSKPFARAFYTEGKSLVYYAYDLPQRKNDEGKFSYVAWGESNGNRANIKKIGILFHDDQAQRRWSLNFTDAQVLREIDSVFITREQNDEDLSQPKGKRMLTAYLATAANHP